MTLVSKTLHKNEKHKGENHIECFYCFLSREVPQRLGGYIQGYTKAIPLEYPSYIRCYQMLGKLAAMLIAYQKIINSYRNLSWRREH